MRAELRKVAKRYPPLFDAGIYRAGVEILRTAIPITPVEFGPLRASGYVSPPQHSGPARYVEVGFGTRYAVPQHERFDYQHPRGGGPKYLERAAVQTAPRVLPIILAAVREGRAWAGGDSGVNEAPPITTDTFRKGGRFVRAGRNLRRKTKR